MSPDQLMELATREGLDMYAYAGPTGQFFAVSNRSSHEALGRFVNRAEELQEALAALLEFHPCPQAYWTAEYTEAVEAAKAALASRGD